MKFIPTTNQELSRVQDAAKEAFLEIKRLPIVQGRLIENVLLSSGDTKIEHKLTRKPRGYIIVRRDNGTSQVYDTQSTDDMYLVLNSNSPIAISLWVFQNVR